MYCVYVLRSVSTGRCYTGFSKDFEARLRAHNAGKCRSTRREKPWVCLYRELVETSLEARSREKFLKSGVGRRFIKSLDGSSGHVAEWQTHRT